MTEASERVPGPDDTAAFQRFYEGRPDRGTGRASETASWAYRLLVGWWRDRR